MITGAYGCINYNAINLRSISLLELSSLTTKANSCPSDWHYHKGVEREYCFTISATKISWMAGNESCHQYGITNTRTRQMFEILTETDSLPLQNARERYGGEAHKNISGTKIK